MVQAPDSESDKTSSGVLDPSGRWVNDGGTVIDLVTHPDGRVSGTIRFASDGIRYKPYQLRGTIIYRAEGRRGIVGTVPGWPVHSAATVWLGEFDSDGTTLSTKLLMADGPDPSVDWEVATGGTVFHRATYGRRSA